VGGERHLPIWIGRFEAEAIAMVLQGVDPARPLPYDLLTNVLGELDTTIERIVVTDLNQDVFYANIVLDRSGSAVHIDSRPSDAIAIAVRAKVPILVEESVMDRAGITMTDEDEEGAAFQEHQESYEEIDEEGLSAFRDFIDTLDLDDFGRKRD
jgi:bifunctional DNase/RNase